MFYNQDPHLKIGCITLIGGRQADLAPNLPYGGLYLDVNCFHLYECRSGLLLFSSRLCVLVVLKILGDDL